MKPIRKKKLGDLGEDVAAQYLINHNYRILERNYRCRIGEIDIIAADGDCIAFVEVKTRSNVYFGLPSEAVNYRKQKKIIDVAAFYLKGREPDVRFDVVELLADAHGIPCQIRLTKNAF